MSAGEPARAARLPDKSARELPDAVEIAFQIREFEFARLFVDRFLAREARGAERKHRCLDRLAVSQFICLADFEQPQIALAVIQIPFERADHADDARRAHHGGVLRERIADYRGRDSLGAKQFIAARVHQRNRHDLLVAERDRAFAQSVFRFGVRQAMRGLLRRRQPRRKFVVAVVPRDFLDQVDFARHITPPRRLSAFPRGSRRASAAAIRVRANRMKSQRAQRFPRYRDRERPRPSRAATPCA